MPKRYAQSLIPILQWQPILPQLLFEGFPLFQNALLNLLLLLIRHFEYLDPLINALMNFVCSFQWPVRFFELIFLEFYQVLIIVPLLNDINLLHLEPNHFQIIDE